MNTLLLNENNSYLLDYRILLYNLIKKFFNKKIKKKDDIVCLKNSKINLSNFLKNEKLLNYNNKNSDVFLYTIPNKINSKIIIKIMPLSYIHIKNIYDTSFKIWRELQILKLLTINSKKRLLPTLPLIYSYYICNSCTFKNNNLQKYNNKLCLLVISEYNTYDLKNWLVYLSKKKISKNKLKQIWLNLIFQILVTLYFLYKKYKLIHNDLHWNNILIQVHKKKGYWLYKIDELSYFIPNLGFTIKLWDFGKCHSNYFFNKKKDKLSINNINELTDLYRISDIYRWIKNDKKINNNIIPPYIINLFNNFKLESNNSLKNIIYKNMYMYLHNKIGTIIPKYIKTVDILYPHYIYRGEIVSYKNRYALVQDIYKFNIYIIININNYNNYINVSFDKIKKIKDNVSQLTNNKYKYLLEENIGQFYL